MAPPDSGERTCVVLGDVVGSRDAADRAALDRRLRAALRATNAAHPAAVGVPLAPRRGVDGFGGTLRDPGAAYDVVRDVQSALRPTVARYAVVVGPVEEVADARDMRAMDGPAVHRAEALLAELRAEGGRLVVETGDPAVDDLATAAGDLALARREDWTDRQAEVVAVYRRHGTQVAAADRLGVTQQAVSKTLAAADHGRLRRAETRLSRALARAAGRRTRDGEAADDGADG